MKGQLIMEYAENCCPSPGGRILKVSVTGNDSGEIEAAALAEGLRYFGEDADLAVVPDYVTYRRSALETDGGEYAAEVKVEVVPPTYRSINGSFYGNNAEEIEEAAVAYARDVFGDVELMDVVMGRVVSVFESLEAQGKKYAASVTIRVR